MMRKLNAWIDKHIWGLPEVTGWCRYCGKPIFSTDGDWVEKEMCIYCYEAYERGLNEKRDD
ncbi:MAG: hypothetical protein KAS32_31400 [Candidatus Peribacteraceae bacterium]|nr:hypothetical protein [Candidatus Peribacteraceae bacterium]